MVTDRTTINCVIRPVRRSDNSTVAQIIHQVMTEFDAVGSDCSISDLEVDNMYESYPAPGAAFFVVECSGTVLGCGGMGPLLEGGPGVCELRKMYFLPELRGASLGTKLLDTILDAAREAGYRQCYLETMKHMHQARTLYRKRGFVSIDAPMGNTGHSACNSWMVKPL
jgi:putative acetyltransferase